MNARGSPPLFSALWAASCSCAAAAELQTAFCFLSCGSANTKPRQIKSLKLVFYLKTKTFHSYSRSHSLYAGRRAGLGTVIEHDEPYYNTQRSSFLLNQVTFFKSKKEWIIHLHRCCPKNQLKLRKTSLPLSALMESERSFVTVCRIDGVEIASRPSPRAREERFRMTEQHHAGPFLPLSFPLVPARGHTKAPSRFNYPCFLLH